MVDCFNPVIRLASAAVINSWRSFVMACSWSVVVIEPSVR